MAKAEGGRRKAEGGTQEAEGASRSSDLARSTILEGGELFVRFDRRGDRLAHTLGTVIDGRRVDLLESLEGSPDDVWPPSPPLQELHAVYQTAGRQLALLVGSAGRSHWSVSVEVDPVACRITFDVACRTTDLPGALASSYHFLQTAEIGAPRDSSRWQIVGDCCEFRVEPIAGFTPAVIEGSNRDLRVRASADSAQSPQTIRWKYAFLGPPALLGVVPPR